VLVNYKKRLTKYIVYSIVFIVLLTNESRKEKMIFQFHLLGRLGQSVMHFGEASQGLGSLFSCQVSLGLSKELIAYHELLDAPGAKKWRIIMGMQKPVLCTAFGSCFVMAVVAWCTMPTHRVREARFEEIIVLGC